jgi:hypothetical protein
MVVAIPNQAPNEPISPTDGAAESPCAELVWLDSDGEAYVAFHLDEEWPEHFGSASVGIP